MPDIPYHLAKTMSQLPDGSWTDPVLHADPTSLIGKKLVVSVRYPKDGKEALAHFYGPIVRINEAHGIVIVRSDGREFAIPPRAYLVEENQREIKPTTLPQLIYPDYSTLITIDGPPSERGWNHAVDKHNPG
jgi:hypothetical protein